MKQFFLIISFIGLTQVTEAQVTTCLPCDQLGMSINVGSDTNSLSIYHSGQYLTHPQEYNTFEWNITDHFGNVIFQETTIDNAFCNFSHNFPISDTMNVMVYLTNDNAILPDGNSIHCMFEDQIYWETGANTPWGSWTFVNNNTGTTVGIDELEINPEFDYKIYDMLGRELKEAPIGQPYIQNGKKRVILN